MRIKKAVIICFFSVLFFSLNINDCVYATENTQKLEGFNQNLEHYPKIKELNDKGNIRLLNNEVKFSEYDSIVFDAVLMDKYTTLILCTVKNNRVDKSNTENYITNMLIKNLNGIENEKYSGLMDWVRINLSDGTQKYSVLYHGKPNEGENKFSILVSTIYYGTQIIDIPLDNINMVNSDYEKNLNVETKIEDNNLKIDRIYCSPLTSLLFIETDENDDSKIRKLFRNPYGYNKSNNIISGLYSDNKKMDGSARCNKRINNMNNYWVSFDSISSNTKKISFKYKDKKITLINGDEINELKLKEKNNKGNISTTMVNTNKYTIQHNIKEKINPKKFNIKENIGFKDSGDKLEIGFTNGSSNSISKYKRINSGESLDIEYKVVCTKGSISIKLLDSDKNVISTIQENQTGTISIQFKENDICYLEVKTGEDTSYYLNFSWKKSK